MADRWGPAGPPEEAYPRVTRDLAEVYAGLPAAVDARLARLVADFDTRVRQVSADQWPHGTGSQPPVTAGARVVVPADPRCLTLWVVLTQTPWPPRVPGPPNT